MGSSAWSGAERREGGINEVEVGFSAAELGGGGAGAPFGPRFLPAPPSATARAFTPAVFQPVTRGKGGRGEEAVFFQGNVVKTGHTGQMLVT